MNLQLFSSLRPSIRRTAVRVALLSLTLPLSHALVAQSRPVATANVPFAFSVGDKVLPAGHYTFVMITPHIYALRQENGATVQYISTLATEPPKKSDASVINFRQYGSSYFLEGAWFASARSGIELFRGKAEKEMQASVKTRNPAGIALALNIGDTQR